MLGATTPPIIRFAPSTKTQNKVSVLTVLLAPKQAPLFLLIMLAVMGVLVSLVAILLVLRYANSGSNMRSVFWSGHENF
jgi:Co/Zn/Cd efflux system component